MSLLDADLLAASAAAFSVGLARSSGWRGRFALCLLIALAAWGVRYALILRGDALTAEDYVNGLDRWTGALEVSAALAWALLCCALGLIAATMVRGRGSKP